MATFQSEYEDTTNIIDGVVTSQLSSVLDWKNIPGELSKVSSSAAGYVWGFKSDNTVWYCQLPCSGTWKPVDLSQYSVSQVLDITTDNSNVYILIIGNSFVTYLLVGSASNTSAFTQISVAFDAKEIFSTHSFIWGQDSSNTKMRCAKPCTMANWVPNPDKTVKITSSSDTSLYGIDNSGNAMRSDETLQSGWTPISSLNGIQVQEVIGDVDTVALYGIDKNSTLFKLENGSLIPQEKQGYTPTSVTVDPINQQMWMTTATTGQLGNVFTRVENTDYSTIMNAITPLDKQRDEIVKDVTKEFNTQTQVMTVNKQVNDVIKYFKDMFHIDRNTGKKGKDQAGHLEEQIYETQKQLDYINSTQPVFQYVIALLLVITILYMLASLLGAVVHILALVLLLAGLYYISNFSGGN